MGGMEGLWGSRTGAAPARRAQLKPIRQIFPGPPAVIYGVCWASWAMELHRHALALSNDCFWRGHGTVVVLSDAEAVRQPRRLEGLNVVVLGGGDLITFLPVLYATSIVSFAAALHTMGAFSVAPRTFGHVKSRMVLFGVYDLSGSEEFRY